MEEKNGKFRNEESDFKELKGFYAVLKGRNLCAGNGFGRENVDMFFLSVILTLFCHDGPAPPSHWLRKQMFLALVIARNEAISQNTIEAQV